MVQPTNSRKRATKGSELSRFGAFLRNNKIKPSVLADVAGVSRQHVMRLRYGKAEPTRPVMIWLTVACRRLMGDRRRVRLTQLFDLGDGEK